MGNRWWALAFVAFVCWQAADFVGDAPGAGNGNQAAAEQQHMRDIANALDAR